MFHWHFFYTLEFESSRLHNISFQFFQNPQNVDNGENKSMEQNINLSRDGEKSCSNQNFLTFCLSP